MKEIITISAYKALNNYNTANRLHKSHIRIMEQVGLNTVTSLDSGWLFEENAYFIVAELQSTKEIIAGARIQIKSPNNILPIEEALNSIGQNFNAHFSQQRTAEFCGLWISKKFAVLGLSCIHIANAIVSLSYALKIECLVGICAKSTADISKRCGFNNDISFGDNLVYPRPDLPAYIITIKNLQNLQETIFEQKDSIIELMQNPILSKMICTPERETEVNYNLNIFSNSVEEEKRNIVLI